MSPVSVDALRKGRLIEVPRAGSHPARVLEFLVRNPREAWRAREIAAALGTDQHTIGAALRRLHARGHVEKKGPFWFALEERALRQLVAAMALTRDLNERLGPEDPRDWAELRHG